ncbi:MAG: Mbov_0399 family ICE element protein, partial [Spiroplasma sp.]
MINILKIFLSSILITSFTISAKETFHELYISSLTDSPFHPDIKISGSDNKRYRIEGNVKNKSNETYTKISEINWKDYANSWEQFKQYYKTITLYGSGYATGKDAGRKNFTNMNISVSSLEQRTTWHDSVTLRASGSKYVLAYSFHQFGGGSIDEAGVYYDAIVAGSLIKIRFQIWTKAHQVGIGSIWTESQIQYNGGIVSSSWNLNTIKASLNTALANQINLKSNYSGSLEDKRNITDPSGKGNDQTTLINSVIAKILDKDYDGWKQYIQPFSFSNATREATIVFKFPDPNTKQQQVWTFKTPINITLSSDYWGKSLSERLHIQPGQIVNPEDSTKGMVPDAGLQLEADKVTETYGGNMQYHTTAHVEFDGMEDSSEWMTVNGQPVEVLNNKFIYDMIDNRVEKGNQADNVYDIIIYHDDGKYKEQYQIKYTIANLVPTLKEKWYAWDPNNNPDQKKLITPTLPNGKPNPDYDKEINAETGTKTQIIWVKKKSQYPFPLDPLDKNGEVIDPNKNAKDYDLGFIAEGSVAGMGVQQLFNGNEVNSVTREGVDNAL